MKQYLITISFLLIAFCIETVFFRWPIFEYFQPNLFLIVLVWSALQYGPIVGVFSGFSLGLIQGVYTVEFMGANEFVKSLIGYVVGLFDVSHFSLTWASKVIILWLVVFFHDIVYRICIGNSFIRSAEIFFKEGLFPSLMTAFIGFFIFYDFKNKLIKLSS